MAQERLAMKNIRELLRLRWESGLSKNQVARALGCGRSTIYDYEKRAKRAGIYTIDELSSYSDEALLEKLGLKRLGKLNDISPRKNRPLPDVQYIHKELNKKHVTLALLWEEYIESHPTGYKYTQFCEHYRRWKSSLSVSLRQSHKAGEKAFIDYAGTTMGIVDKNTGELRQCQLFVGVLGASSYTFAEATWTQQLPDWLMSHRRMFEFFGGVPEILVPDNLKSAVTTPDRYEARINKSYEDLASYYGTCVIPARSRKPKDKAKAESAVLLASRWIVAALRHKTFFSLEELNQAIEPLLIKLNNRKMKKINRSRLDQFEEIDQPALGKLRNRPYEVACWKKATVNVDYHVEFEKHYYSVPSELIKRSVDIRATASVVEIFCRNERVSSHPRSYIKHRYTTNDEHRPKTHQKHLEWTPEKIVNWGNNQSESVGRFIEQLIKRKAHPEQGYRSALGVIRLAKKYGSKRLSKACENALTINAISYRTINNILKNNMEDANVKDNQQLQLTVQIDNENVRGSEYYH